MREVGYRNMRGEDLSATDDDDEDERDERAFDAFNGQEKGHHRHTRDSSVTFFTGNENEREMLVGTPRTNFRADEEGGEEEEGDNDNRRKSLDGYERSKSFDKPRRGGGLSAAFSDFDLTASSIEKPPRVPPKEFWKRLTLCAINLIPISSFQKLDSYLSTQTQELNHPQLHFMRIRNHQDFITLWEDLLRRACVKERS